MTSYTEKFPNMVICLTGDLGSGKTFFTQAFAKALGIKEPVTSPTFNIIKEYLDGEAPLFHMDFYRCEENICGFSIDEYFTKKGVVIIEWAELIQDELPKNRLDIHFDTLDEDTRIITITPHGKKYEELCEATL